MSLPPPAPSRLSHSTSGHFSTEADVEAFWVSVHVRSRGPRASHPLLLFSPLMGWAPCTPCPATSRAAHASGLSTVSACGRLAAPGLAAAPPFLGLLPESQGAGPLAALPDSLAGRAGCGGCTQRQPPRVAPRLYPAGWCQGGLSGKPFLTHALSPQLYHFPLLRLPG